MIDDVRDLIGEELCENIVKCENENKDNDDAYYKLYIHIIPKEVTGHDIDKYYVGKTKRSFQVRFGGGGKGYSHSPHFYNAIKRYGWDNIVHKYLTEKLTSEQASSFEKKIIKLLKSNEKYYGYNCTVGGDGGNTKPVTPVKQYDKYGNYIASYESAAEAARQAGLNRGAVTHACRSTRMAGGFQWCYEEDEITGMYKRQNCRHVYQYSLDGELIHVYFNETEAFTEIGSNREALGKACRGHTILKDCYWSYERMDKNAS